MYQSLMDDGRLSTRLLMGKSGNKATRPVVILLKPKRDDLGIILSGVDNVLFFRNPFIQSIQTCSVFRTFVTVHLK